MQRSRKAKTDRFFLKPKNPIVIMKMIMIMIMTMKVTVRVRVIKTSALRFSSHALNERKFLF